ncbi:MAG TPA: hypothetical protein VN181_10950 [Thermoanaerobaculia bacterium]|nr:hypothetical protein [Thermoanaerobaculia bacterium]
MNIRFTAGSLTMGGSANFSGVSAGDIAEVHIVLPENEVSFQGNFASAMAIVGITPTAQNSISGTVTANPPLTVPVTVNFWTADIYKLPPGETSGEFTLKLPAAG